jgi:hypothetical protein
VRRRGDAPPRQEALAEEPDLATGIVHVVLTGHLRPGALENAGKGVAVGTEPSVADVHGTGRVRRDELDLGALATAEVGRGVPGLGGGHDLDERLVQPGGPEPEIHETRPRHLHGLHVGRWRCGERCGELPGDVSRVAARSLGESEGDVGGEVAVLGSGRPLEMHVRRRRLDTEVGQLGGDGLGEDVRDAHGRSEDDRSAGSMQTAKLKTRPLGTRCSVLPPS